MCYMQLLTMMVPAVFFFLLALSASVTADPIVQTCSGGNYTAKSAFRSNLNHLLSSLSSSNASFLTVTKGRIPNRAYGLVLCRGDLPPAACSACFHNAAHDVRTLCTVSKRATVWYDHCELRYGDRSFFHIGDPNGYIMSNITGAEGDTGYILSFVRLVTRSLDAVVHAAAHNSSSMFATAIASNGSLTIYALAQCTRDLSTHRCGRCLKELRGFFKGFDAQLGGTALGQSCNFRYELYHFFAGAPTVSLSPPAHHAPLLSDAVEKGAFYESSSKAHTGP